jgi:hypothetical protein
MRNHASLICAIAGGAAALLIGAAPARAQQTASTPAQGSNGPLVLEPIRPSTVVAIDAQATDVNGSIGTLAGGYVGRVLDESLFIGGAGYGLTTRVGGVQFGYGGVVLGLQSSAKQAVSVGVKTLVGFGEASVDQNVAFALPMHDPGHWPPSLSPSNVTFRYHSSFTIAEPEVFLQMRVSPRVQVNLGAGYRAIGDANGLESAIRGATAHAALQFSFGG